MQPTFGHIGASPADYHAAEKAMPAPPRQVSPFELLSAAVERAEIVAYNVGNMRDRLVGPRPQTGACGGPDESRADGVIGEVERLAYRLQMACESTMNALDDIGAKLP